MKQKQTGRTLLRAGIDLLCTAAVFGFCLVLNNSTSLVYYGSSGMLAVYALDAFGFSLAFVPLLAAIQLSVGERLGVGRWEKLLPFAAALVVFGVAQFFDRSARPIAVIALVAAVMRGLLFFVDIFLHKRRALLCMALAVVFAAGFTKIYTSGPYQRLRETFTDQRDRTAGYAWDSINQTVGRGEDWKQIVSAPSPFQLGDCKPSAQDGGDLRCAIGTWPAMDGSTVCVPMAAEFARQHLRIDDDNANIFTSFNTTHYAYERLIGRESNYYPCPWKGDGAAAEAPVELFLGTEPSEEELAMARAAGVDLVKKPVCCDAFVFITHKDNPVDSLTVEQIRDIYTGKIKNWKEVGGANRSIRAYQRDKNSGSQTAMENLVMDGQEMLDPIYSPIAVGMGMLVDAVAEYENSALSIGYTYKYYVDTLYKSEDIKTIAVDGVPPTPENIQSGVYPFSTYYYGVIRKGDEEKTGGVFLDWIRSEEGQRCVAQAGYIPLGKTN